MNGIITNSETGEIIGTVDLNLNAPISEYIKEYTVDNHYKMCYKRWRMVRRVERLLCRPRRFKGFSVKIKEMRFAYFSNNK